LDEHSGGGWKPLYRQFHVLFRQLNQNPYVFVFTKLLLTNEEKEVKKWIKSTGMEIRDLIDTKDPSKKSNTPLLDLVYTKRAAIFKLVSSFHYEYLSHTF